MTLSLAPILAYLCCILLVHLAMLHPWRSLGVLRKSVCLSIADKLFIACHTGGAVFNQMSGFCCLTDRSACMTLLVEHVCQTGVFTSAWSEKEEKQTGMKISYYCMDSGVLKSYIQYIYNVQCTHNTLTIHSEVQLQHIHTHLQQQPRLHTQPHHNTCISNLHH